MSNNKNASLFHLVGQDYELKSKLVIMSEGSVYRQQIHVCEALCKIKSVIKTLLAQRETNKLRKQENQSVTK